MRVQVVKRRGQSQDSAGGYAPVAGPARSTEFYQYCPVDSWRPAVNLYESPDSYFVCVDLAGVERDTIDVTARGNVLIISGTREHPRLAGACLELSIHLMEIDQGPFCRSVEIPSEVDVEAIRATYGSSGYLWIELPRRRA